MANGLGRCLWGLSGNSGECPIEGTAELVSSMPSLWSGTSHRINWASLREPLSFQIPGRGALSVRHWPSMLAFNVIANRHEVDSELFLYPSAAATVRP